MKRQIRLLLFFLVALGFSAGAQELRVQGMYPAMEILAGDWLRTDANGANCALVRVQLPVAGAAFEGNIVGNVKFSVNEYLVYLIPGSRHLKVKCPGYKSSLVDFSQYGVRGVEPKRVYMLDMVIPATSSGNAVQSEEAQESPRPHDTLSYDAAAGELRYKNFVYRMVPVSGGTFSMGGTAEQGGDAYDDEKPVHQVIVSDFNIGETEVPQWLWEVVMGDNPSAFKGEKHPVEMITWNACQDFLQTLNAMTGQEFRLPTEAEWEYAARGGNRSRNYKYSGSDRIEEVAWFKDNSEKTTHDVASKLPNELGLYDMSGNVWEWCQDWYGSYSASSETNPSGPSSGSNRVDRGGGWFGSPRSCRVSRRSYSLPSSYYGDFGLRLAQ